MKKLLIILFLFLIYFTESHARTDPYKKLIELCFIEGPAVDKNSWDVNPNREVLGGCEKKSETYQRFKSIFKTVIICAHNSTKNIIELGYYYNLYGSRDGKNCNSFGQPYMELYHVKDNVFTFSKDVAVQANNFDNDTLTKLLNAAKDFRNGKISEKQFDKLKDEILKSL